jgi:hypothetical protein
MTHILAVTVARSEVLRGEDVHERRVKAGGDPAHMLVANGTLTLAEAVARLYNAAGWAWLRAAMPAASADDAQRWIEQSEARNSAWLDYVNNRPLKIDVDKLRTGDPSVFANYDRCNTGSAADALRDHRAFVKSPRDSHPED